MLVSMTLVTMDNSYAISIMVICREWSALVTILTKSKCSMISPLFLPRASIFHLSFLQRSEVWSDSNLSPGHVLVLIEVGLFLLRMGQLLNQCWSWYLKATMSPDLTKSFLLVTMKNCSPPRRVASFAKFREMQKNNFAKLFSRKWVENFAKMTGG